MSMNNLTKDGEFRYIVQWFNEWSELQRDDFVTELVEYLTKHIEEGVYMNGVLNSVANAGINDKPMSLFQCRVKLFRQWTPNWPLEFKHKLKEKVLEMDAKVGEKIINELKRYNDGLSNGNENGAAAAAAEDLNNLDAVVSVAVSIVEETENALNVEQRLVTMLNNDVEATQTPMVEDNLTRTVVAINMPAESAEQQQEILSQTQQHDQQQQQQHVNVAQTISNNAEVPLVA